MFNGFVTLGLSRHSGLPHWPAWGERVTDWRQEQTVTIGLSLPCGLPCLAAQWRPGRRTAERW